METASKHDDWFVGPWYFARLSYLVDRDDAEHLLNLFIEQGSFFGNPVPQDYIDERHNLLEDLYNDPQDGEHTRAIIGHLKSVSIEDGKLVITPRRDSDSMGTYITAEKVIPAKPTSSHVRERSSKKKNIRHSAGP